MTYEEYKALVEEYISEGLDDENRIRWTLLNGKMIDRAEKSGNWPINWTATDIFSFYTEEMIFSISSASNRLATMSRFYKYEIEKGRIDYNPCDNALLTPRNIVENTKKRKNYYTDQDIEKIIQSFEYNIELNTALLLTYYEGVAMRSQNVAELKMSNFHPKQNEIDIRTGTKKISKRLSDAYRSLVGIDYVIGDKPIRTRSYRRRRTPAFKINPDDLFPTTGHKVDFLNSRIRIMGLISGYDLNCYDLYYSGFLNYIAKDIGEKRAVELVLGGSLDDHAELCSYADKYLMPYIRDKIRGALRATAIAMKEYLM